MSEQPTTTQASHDNYDDAYELQLADAARRVALEHSVELQEYEDKKEKEEKLALKILSGLGVAVSLGAGGIALSHSIETVQPSEQKIEITVQPGDGIQSIAEQVPGYEKNPLAAIDSIKGDPANIDVLKDGLQPGERITVPVNFK